MNSSSVKIMSALSGAASRIATTANVVGTLVVLGLVAIVNYDIVARGLFNQPFRGAIEVVQFSIVLIVFLQLPDVVRVGRLTRSDGLILLMASRHPRVGRALQRFVDIISATVMALLAIAIYPEFIEMWESDDFFGLPGVFTAPWWPIKLTILCSTALCMLLFVFKFIMPDIDSNKTEGEPQ